MVGGASIPSMWWHRVDGMKQADGSDFSMAFCYVAVA